MIWINILGYFGLGVLLGVVASRQNNQAKWLSLLMARLDVQRDLILAQRNELNNLRVHYVATNPMLAEHRRQYLTNDPTVVKAMQELAEQSEIVKENLSFAEVERGVRATFDKIEAEAKERSGKVGPLEDD